MPDWSLLEVLDLIDTGAVTPIEAFEAYASATERWEPELRAFAHLDIDQARNGLDARAALPLKGLPIAIKDLFDVADMPTTYGSPIYEGHRPRADAALVARLRALGASIVGKAMTTEFAARHPGPTRNPHDLARSPGGSSSGTAAAVGAGASPIGLGTQTAGSVIRPAAFCGVAGFKPSYGMLPLAGAKPLSWSLDTAGLIGRTLADCAWLYHQLRGAPPSRLPEDDRPLRIGVVRTPHWDQASPEAQGAVGLAAERLRAEGAIVEDLNLPEPLLRLDAAHGAIMAYESAASFGWERAAVPEMLSSEFVELIEQGLAVTADEHAAALRAAREARRAMDGLGDAFDLLLTPASPGPAPLGLDFTGSPVFNRLWTGLHVPCATIPIAVDSPAPVGAQFVGFQGQDDVFLARAVGVERLLRA